jgi:hypothetical protein
MRLTWGEPRLRSYWPTKLADLCRPQAMPVRHQDHGRITVTVPVLAGQGHQLLHLTGRQIFPRAEVAVELSDGNCPIFSN